MPRELVAIPASEVVIREVNLRPAGDGEVVIRSDYAAAKHGTEMAMVKGYGDRGRFDPEMKVFLPDSDGGNAAVARPVGNMVVGTVT